MGKRIDRAAWKPCRVCGQYEVLGFRGWRRQENMLKHPDGSGGCMYCPHCGRPRNEKAWAQLEQRLRGEQVDEPERGQSEAGDRLHLIVCEKCGTLALTKAVAPQVAANLTLGQPTLTPPNEWVSVEERLPEPGGRVLAANGSFVGEAYMASNGAWMRHDGFPWEVDAWMPMPDRRPPEGEEDI